MPPRNQFTNNRIAIDHMTKFQLRQAGRIIYFAEIEFEARLVFSSNSDETANTNNNVYTSIFVRELSNQCFGSYRIGCTRGQLFEPVSVYISAVSVCTLQTHFVNTASAGCKKYGKIGYILGTGARAGQRLTDSSAWVHCVHFFSVHKASAAQRLCFFAETLWPGGLRFWEEVWQTCWARW